MGTPTEIKLHPVSTLSKQQPTNYSELLPDELWVLIFSFLDQPSVSAAAYAYPRFLELAADWYAHRATRLQGLKELAPGIGLSIVGALKNFRLVLNPYASAEHKKMLQPVAIGCFEYLLTDYHQEWANIYLAYLYFRASLNNPPGPYSEFGHTANQHYGVRHLQNAVKFMETFTRNSMMADKLRDQYRLTLELFVGKIYPVMMKSLEKARAEHEQRLATLGEEGARQLTAYQKASRTARHTLRRIANTGRQLLMDQEAPAPAPPTAESSPRPTLGTQFLVARGYKELALLSFLGKTCRIARLTLAPSTERPVIETTSADKKTYNQVVAEISQRVSRFSP